MATFSGHTGAVFRARFSPNGARILTASEDHTAKVWDTASGALLATLDARVGRGRYVLALSADHGVCPLPEAARARGHDAGRMLPAPLKAKANSFLVEKFGGDDKSRYFDEVIPPWFYLNQGLLKAKGLDPAEVGTALATWLAEQEGISRSYTRAQLIAGAAECLTAGGWLLIEIGYDQEPEAIRRLGAIPGLVPGPTVRDGDGHPCFALADGTDPTAFVHVGDARVGAGEAGLFA